MTPKDHDFNWVKARRECSVLCEMSKLSSAVKACVEARRLDANGDPRANIRFRELSKEHFCVCRLSVPSQGDEDFDWCVHFTRDNPEEIKIEQSGKRGPEKCYRVTLTLSDDGECRYRINDEGKYLRWQVAKIVLEGLLFGSQPDSVGVEVWK